MFVHPLVHQNFVTNALTGEVVTRFQSIITLFLALMALQYIINGSLPASSYTLPSQQFIVATYFLYILLTVETFFVHKYDLTKQRNDQRSMQVRVVRQNNTKHVCASSQIAAMQQYRARQERRTTASIIRALAHHAPLPDITPHRHDAHGAHLAAAVAQRHRQRRQTWVGHPSRARGPVGGDAGAGERVHAQPVGRGQRRGGRKLSAGVEQALYGARARLPLAGTAMGHHCGGDAFCALHRSGSAAVCAALRAALAIVLHCLTVVV